MFSRLVTVSGLLTLLLSGCSATQNNLLVDFLTPAPVGVAITVGKWLVKNNQSVFEVTVEGYGNTPTEARENAYKKAVEQAVGSLSLRQTEVTNGKITQNRQLLYSSGFVEDFKDLELKKNSDGTWAVSLVVWVKHSSIADGLIGQQIPANSSFDGGKKASQITSREHEINSSLQLMIAVLDKWPIEATKVSYKTAQFTYTQEQQVLVSLKDIKVGMTSEFEKSLWEMIDRIKLDCFGCNGYAAISSGGLGWARHEIQYKSQFDLIEKTFRKPMQLQVSLYDGYRLLQSTCVGDPKMQITSSSYRYYLPTKTKRWDYLQFYVDKHILEQITRISVHLVSPTSCT